MLSRDTSHWKPDCIGNQHYIVALNVPWLLVILSIPWALRDYNTDRIY